jgi:two-component system alkaline phosphatase synthesis response regulator PhoP
MSKHEYTILLIDDEPDIIEIFSHHLIQEGYKVHTAFDGKEGLEMAKKYLPHLIIMDVMMPVMDGVETCEQIRMIDSLKNVIIVFLTARSEDYSQIAGFNAGADDYVAKPIKLKVLSSRVKALLKRYGVYTSENNIKMAVNTVKYGNLEIDKEKHLVIVDGKEISLPKKEFKLLLLLSSKPGNVFTRETIFTNIWGDDVIVCGRTIDVHIRNLRKKIGDQNIMTIKGIGYKFRE